MRIERLDPHLTQRRQPFRRRTPPGPWSGRDGSSFFFIVYHLLHFTWGRVQPQFFDLVDPQGRRDVYGMVVHGFQSPVVCVSYIVAMAVLCFHLSHGLQSLFQSLGLRSSQCEPLIQKSAVAMALFVFLGNCSIPLAVFFGWVRPGGIF